MDREKIKRRLFIWYSFLWFFIFLAIYIVYIKYVPEENSTISKWSGLAAGAIAIYIDLYVYRTTQHHTFTIWANGQTGKFDWISLGSAGGSSANCYYYVDSQYASATNTVDIKSYSWV